MSVVAAPFKPTPTKRIAALRAKARKLAAKLKADLEAEEEEEAAHAGACWREGAEGSCQ